MRRIWVLIGVIGSSEASAKPGSTPGPFKDEYDSRLASDGQDLWLAETGRDDSGKVQTQVWRYRGPGWSALGGPSPSTTDYAVSLVVHKRPGAKQGEPCVGYDDRKHSSLVRCFQGGRWVEPDIPGALKGSHLVDLQSRDGEVVGLFYKRIVKPKLRFSTVFRVVRLVGRRFVIASPRLRVGKQAIAKLVQSTAGTPDRPLAIGVLTQNQPAQRWVETLVGSRWSRSKALPKHLVGGSMTSGPVRSGDSTFFPVVQADLGPHPFLLSVFARRKSKPWREVSGSPVNTGFGSAQGNLDPVGRRIWITWAELDAKGVPFGGIFPTRIFASRISSSGKNFGKRIKLWSGKTIFPPVTQAVEYHGRPVFLYQRQFSRKGGLHSKVDFSHG